MAYTVKRLANISGVSVRTLHWYDKIGLLKPFSKGSNNYRYYEEHQLLRLQQILFFKELGFSLSDIQKLLSQQDFDNIQALHAHKNILEDKISRKQELIKTIDKTIQHLKGENIMKNEKLYCGFDCNCKGTSEEVCDPNCNCHKKYEQYIVKEYGTQAEKLLKESHIRISKWDKDEWENVKSLGDQIHKDLANAINNDLAPESQAVQVIIKRHYELQNKFYTMNKEVYVGLTDLYYQHPDFKKFFDPYHPNMIEFIGKAMRYYADTNL